MAKTNYLSLDEIDEPSTPTYYSLDDIAEPVEEKGFFSNVGDLLVEGGKTAIASAKVAPAVVAGSGVEEKAGIIAEQLAKSQTTQPKELQEVKGAFKDEGEAWEKADGFFEGAGAVGQMLFEVGRQAITNPKGLAYLTAEQAANMAPAIVGMIAGGKAGGMAGSVAGPKGAVIGAAGGAVAGAFTGQAPLEIGSEFVGLVGKELAERGLEPTEANVAALLKEQEFTERAIGDARVKGATTAGIDAALTVVSGGIATGPRRVALKAATEELGAGADAVQIAKRAGEILDQRTIGQKVGTGATAVGVDVAGGGLSEAGGQLAAYGQVDLADVGLEMLGELGGAGIEVPAAAYSVTRDQISRRRQLQAEETLRAAPDVSTAAAAANELAGSLDELTSSVDQYLESPRAQAADLPAPPAPPEAPQISVQQAADREAKLLAEAEQAQTEFDRRMALDQAAVLRAQPQPGASTGFVDLTPMDEMQAQQRLTVLRDQTAQVGGNALGLTVVPHPAQPGRFAIAEQALPSLDLPTTSTPISTQEAQTRIEASALAGQEQQRRAEDGPRQAMISRAMAAIESRGGVASPMEAEILRQANMGQPYNSIDPSLNQSTVPAVTIPRETVRPGAVEAVNAESMAEQTARSQANQAQGQTQLNQQIEQTSQPAPLPSASDLIAALATPGPQRTAEQTSLIRQGENRYDPVDFSIMQRAATAPFQLNADERVRLKDLRTSTVTPSVTNATETVASTTPTDMSMPESSTTVPDSGLTGTRVLERLGTPTPGRIITSGAKLSTTRNVAPGATIDINDGGTLYQARVVDIGQLGNTGRLINLIGRIFGKRVVAFESDTLQADGFVMDDDNQTIYLNTTSQISPLAVFGHEMTHLLKRDNAEAYSALEAVVKRQLGEGAMDRFTQEYGEGANLEELISDLVGNRFQEADFWQGVFDEISAQNPEGARGIIIRTAAAITKAINAFMRLVRQPNFQADQYVKDANEIKKAVRTALATYAQSQKASAMQMEAEIARAEPRVDLTAGSRPEPRPAAAPAAASAAAPAAPERAPFEQRQREAARSARQQMGETITASPSRVGYNVSDANLGDQNARPTDNRRDADVPEGAGANRQEPRADGGSEAPSYGQPSEGAISVLARHYSRDQRQSLSGSFYGQGLRGAEAQRLAQSSDPRIRYRVYFYADAGQGIRPEAGVGSIAHEVQLNNIYDPATGLIDRQPNANAFESAVLNAGFDGYIAPFGNQNAVVLLGPQHSNVPVRPVQEGSSAQLSRTRNVPDTIDAFARLEQIFPRARAGSFNTNRELKNAIQQSLLAAARDAKIDLSARTPEVEQYLVRVGAADALYAIRSNANAVGWYDKTVTKALKILGRLHPEIDTDPNAKFAFTWALAVTSNGQKVDKNFELAEAAYKSYKRTGRMPTNLQAGQAQKAINESLGLFNEMVDQYGIDNVRRFMDTKFLVSQIERATGLAVGGEFKDTEVRGAAVLGPKIGNGFFSNLNGFFDQLTMDRWLMRTWGRWTGSLIERRPDMVKAKREELVTLVAEMKKNAPAAAQFQEALGRKLTVGDPDALALAIQKASMDPATREKFNKTQVGESLRKTGNALAKYLDGQKEAPAGPEERNFIRKVFSQILDEVREKGFPSLTMSDLQALLWYPEKRLYDTAKSNEDAQEGYADDEAPDYANAAAKLAKANGVADKDIKSAISEAEKEYETRERAGSTQRDAGDQQAEARPEGGARGFTQQGKRQFLTTGVIHRIRSDRSGDAQQSGPYSRKSGGSGAGLRVLGQPSVAVYSPAAKFKNALGQIPAAAPKFFELDAQGAQLFQDAIQASKDASPFGAAVFVYPADDYQGMRLFLTEDAKAGFALNGDDIVSVFAGPEQRGAVNAIMQLAVQEGGRRLDAFNTVLPELYSVHGFKTVARTTWNDEFAPDGWNKATFQAFNDGEPDIVFMVYDANYFGAPSNEDGVVVDSYEDGPAVQREALGGETQSEVVSTDDSAADVNVQFSRRRKPDPKKTVTAYKLFRVDPRKPGQLFPLFVNANDPVEMGVWLDADIGEQTADGKVKSKLGPLAFRPGWHAGDVPIATHIGSKSDPALTAPDTRPANHVWAEVEMAADRDWQKEANKRGMNKDGKLIAGRAHITDQVPTDGYYRYKTNPNMTGNWLIGGSMKVNRILSDTEVEQINADAGVADLPREEPFDAARFGFDAPAAKFSRQRTSPFYSQLGRAIDQVPERLATQPAAQWKAWLASNASKLGIKKEEIEWTGINEYLDLRGKDKVTKAEIGEYLAANGVQVEEVQLEVASEEMPDKYIIYDEGLPIADLVFDTEAEAQRWIDERIDANLQGNYRNQEEVEFQRSLYEIGSAEENDMLPKDKVAQYEQYVLPGAKNYKELLLTLPPKTNAVMEYQVIGAFPSSGFKSKAEAQQYIDNFDKMLDTLPQESAQAMRERLERNPFSINSFETKQSRSEKFKSRHWKQENVLAHVRFNERTDADGNRVLFIEELQSDWAQEGRKRGFSNAELGTAENPIRLSGGQQVPAAPFVQETKSWLSLGVKRMIAYAVDNGFDKVAFINGKQSADRYNLAKRVDYIEYEQTDPGKYYIRVTGYNGGRILTEYQQTPADLEDKIGKDLTNQILAGEGEKGDDGNTLLRAKDFKMGGEGMTAFYDKIVPQVVSDVLKKVGGGKLEAVAFEPEQIASREDRQDYAAGKKAIPDTIEQPGFTITDGMKAKVEEGLPLFSRRRNIFSQAAPLASWTAPTDTKLDDTIYVMQDKMVDTRRVVEAVRAAVGRIDDKWNPYLQEELYHGRTAKATKDFLNDELRPLLQEMQMRKIDMAEFEEYLHNRHAEERNIQIAKVNQNMPDGGSEIDTADARAYLSGLDPNKRRQFESLARRVDAITASTRQLLINSGLETQDTIDTWESTYQNYVPLQREDLDFSTQFSGMGTGQGYQVKGPASKRATGSSRPVVDIMANIAMQRERAIVRAEKTRVAQAVYGMAVQNPNTDFWLAIDPAGEKDPTKAIQSLISMGINPVDAQNIIEEPKQTFIDPRTGLVTQRVNPLLRSSPNVLAVRINGEEKYVFFNANDERSQRMVGALKNLDADQLGRVMSMTATVTRYFASVNTQYNPIFGVINFIRDNQGALLQLSTTPIADRKKEVLANVIPALRGIYADVRAERKGQAAPGGVWASLWEEFQREGGQTGYRDQFSRSAERAEALERELKRMSEGKVKQAGRVVFDWLADYNETMENAVRLSAYKAAKDKGLSNQQAASIAKNLTVNFNRKGQVATQAGALYAFFNAAVQGTTRLGQTLTGPAGKKIMAGGLLLGVAQAAMLAAAGFGDDEPPDFVKERNLIIPIGNGKYLTVPMPLGYNVIPNTSRVLTEYVMSGFRDPAKRVGQITGAFLEMFNPIGNAGWSVQTLAPTVVDPLVALTENRDWTGKPIAKEDRSNTDPTPGYTRAKETASWFSKQLSYYLNLASGGTKYQQGLISLTPDQIDYLIGQVTGGVGRELMKVEQTVTSSVTGEELPTYKVPLVGRFYGDSKSAAAESNRFYENITRINEHENEIKGRRENREPLGDYLKDNPDARLVNMANQVERDVSEMRKRRRELLEKGASKETIQMIEKRIAGRMKQFNDRVRALRDQEPNEGADER
jgi:hypothetical protein